MSLYVYGFVDRAGRPRTIAGHRIEIRPVAGLHVAVEECAAAPAVSASALRAQQAIVDRLARTFRSVLPARFGSLLAREELAAIVRLRKADIRTALRTIRDRVQMTVRLFTPPATAPAPASVQPSSGTAYLQARRAAAAAPGPPLAVAVGDAVRAIARAERMEVDAVQGRTSLFHLVDRGETRRYRLAIARVPVPPGQRITVAGPYPPFAFAPELWP